MKKLIANPCSCHSRVGGNPVIVAILFDIRSIHGYWIKQFTMLHLLFIMLMLPTAFSFAQQTYNLEIVFHTECPADSAEYFGVALSSAGDFNGDGWNDILLGTITLPPDSLVTLNHVIPTVLYKDNTINVKIIGNNNQAVSAILALHEFEPEGVKGDNHAKANGPQGSGSKPVTSYQLSLTVLPTHTTRSLTIK